MSDIAGDLKALEKGVDAYARDLKNRGLTLAANIMEMAMEAIKLLAGQNAALKEENERFLKQRQQVENQLAVTQDNLLSATDDNLRLEARVAELEKECDDDQLLNKYAVCINGAVTQHVYSRVNSDAQSVYERLVDIHHYNPDISVHFVACEIQGPSQ